MRAACTAAILAGLGACAPAAPEAPPAPLVRAEVSPEVAAAAAGEARVSVRAVTVAGAGVAADCAAEGRGFRAAFTAPAEVAVPAFGQASPPVTVRCASAGLAGTAVVQPSARRANGLAGWPAIGVGVGSGGGGYVSVGGFWNGGWGAGPQTVAVRYPAVEVVLR